MLVFKRLAQTRDDDIGGGFLLLGNQQVGRLDLFVIEPDAIVIVVSEETQEISLVQHGTITIFHDEQPLTAPLRKLLAPRRKTSLWHSWLTTLHNHEKSV